MDVVGLEDYNDMSVKEREMLGLEGSAKEIDQFVLKTIMKREWEPTLESYRDIVSEMMKNAAVDKHELPNVKLSKLHQTMKYLIELAKFKQMKEQVKRIDESE